jgi:hypothetical protein
MWWAFDTWFVASGFSRKIAVACAVAMALAWSALASAHEAGTTRVTARFASDRSYQVELVADAAALVEKLEALAGESAPGSSSGAAGLADRLIAHERAFLQRVRVMFDGERAVPEVSVVVMPAADTLSPPTVIIRLTGTVPRGARSFSWSYGWTFAAYALSTMPESGPVATTWIEGPEASDPISLASLPSAPARPQATWQYLLLGLALACPVIYRTVERLAS